MSKFKWPILEFHLMIPFIRVETNLFTESFERRQYTYVGIRIEVWKWSGFFRLYRPGERS